MKSVNTWVEKLKTAGEKHTDKTGNAIWRFSAYGGERYKVDFANDFRVEGWEQYDTDQDARYFGAWVNPKTRHTLSFAEGDWCVTECADVEHYNANIRDMNAFYGEGRIALVIGAATGQAVEYAQERERFLIPTDGSVPAPQNTLADVLS